MIPKITLKELWQITSRRSSLITIPRLSELLEFNNEFSHDQVFYGIALDALDKFKYYYPLNRIQKSFLTVDESKRILRLEDNFKDYENGIITEDQLFLLPTAVVGISYNSTVSSIFPLRNFKYDDGVFSDFWYPSGTYWMHAICNYPFPEHFDEKGEATDKCAIYFMEKDSGPRFKTFKDQLYVEFCRYIWNIRQNFQLQNLPIDVFQGLQDDSQRVQADLDRIYENALTASAWIM